jgi:outer membrane protein insertion porin family
VKPNPELRSVVATGSGSLPTSVMQEAFAGLHGKTLNFASFARAVEKVDRWYRSTGVLGQVGRHGADLAEGCAAARAADSLL